jgi:hypothetical protein
MTTKKNSGYGARNVFFAIAVIIELAFVACDNDPEPDPGPAPHVHDWNDWVTTAATCTEAGKDTRTCKLDATHIETRNEVAALGHIWGSYVPTAATCETVGGEISTCSRDATHKDIRNEVAALGHDWKGDWTQTDAPTDTVNGAETQTCNRDATHKDTRTLWATGTAGLAFELISGGNNDGTYRLRRGTFDGATLHIPAYHRATTNYTDYKLVTIIGGSGSGNGNYYGEFVEEGVDWVPNTTLTTVTFAAESELNTINKSAFSLCTSLTTITLPASLTTIGVQAFNGCTSLASVTIPDGVATPGDVTASAGIGDWAFNGCTSLTTVTLPAGLTSAGTAIFDSCRNLTTVILPASLTSISNQMFNACRSLTSVTLPASLTSIGNNAFSGCSALASIIIPEGVTSIGNTAFMNCTSLTAFTIPASVASLGANVFNGCNNLATITLDANNPHFAVHDGILYNKAKTEIAVVPPQLSGAITIPASITSIGASAFGGTKITSVNFEAGSQLTTIGAQAFCFCGNLTAFTIPANVTEIGAFVFLESTRLLTITCLATTPPTLGGSLFGQTSRTIMVPAASVSAYQAHQDWGVYTIVAIQ